ncbi:hypothetical protein GEV33_008071 [Tenebrio molitor]|uniref:Uncharacterized protein n=1 Tax=Tenebrio molitor TaxID=7067 RepID=A0A8J6LAF8_TENMO|nr:hypothetical protein GEV33_008071 [Tenebrio molitor]
MLRAPTPTPERRLAKVLNLEEVGIYASENKQRAQRASDISSELKAELLNCFGEDKEVSGVWECRESDSSSVPRARSVLLACTHHEQRRHLAAHTLTRRTGGNLEKNVPASEFIRFGDLFELGVEGVAFPRDEATWWVQRREGDQVRCGLSEDRYVSRGLIEQEEGSLTAPDHEWVMNVPRIPSATMAPTERFWCAEHSGYPELYKEDICICLCRVYVISYRVCPFASRGTAPLGFPVDGDCSIGVRSDEKRILTVTDITKLSDICHPPGSAAALSAPLAPSAPSAPLARCSQSRRGRGCPSQIRQITLLNNHCIFQYRRSQVLHVSHRTGTIIVPLNPEMIGQLPQRKSRYIHMLNEAQGMSSRADPSSGPGARSSSPTKNALNQGVCRLKTNAIFLSSLYKRGFFGGRAGGGCEPKLLLTGSDEKSRAQIKIAS